MDSRLEDVTVIAPDWGKVGTWTARAPVTSRGPSGIGFVNFGVLDRLDVLAPLTMRDLNSQVAGVVAVLRELRGDVVEFVAAGQAA